MQDRQQIHSDQDLEALKEIIRGRMESLRQQSPLPLCSFWDFDGTLFKGDLAEGLPQGYAGLMEKVMEADLIPAYQGTRGIKSFWQEYDRLLNQRADLAYSFMGKVVESLPSALQQTLLQFCRQYLEQDLSPFFFAGSLALWRFLQEEGIRNFIISASPTLFVRASTSILRIPEADIYGINSCDLTLYGEGKALMLKKLLQDHRARPLLAAGNTPVSDGPMCREAVAFGGLSLFANGPAPFEHEDAWEIQLNILMGETGDFKDAQKAVLK